jgi:hypothetical protein
MLGRYYDLAADTEIDLDIEAPEAAYLGYRRCLSDTADSEWFGAQDPVEHERKRLARHGRADWYVNKTTARNRPVTLEAGPEPDG